MMISFNMIFFAHIPKCAGKSFCDGLKDAYGDKLQLYYNNPIKKHLKNRWVSYRIFQTIRRWKGRVQRFPNKEIIYGHYCLDDFSYLRENADTYCGAFFREPIEWVGSYLFYTKQKYSGQLDAAEVIKDIKRLRLNHGYSMFMGTYQVEDLDFVGIVENYDQSLLLFEKTFGLPIKQSHKNKTSDAPNSYRVYFEQEGILSDVERLMEENRIIYNKARALHKKLCNNYGI